jgi:ATP-dependent DNA ligase
VVLGYKVDREGRLTTLLLGTAYRSQLVFAGRVTPKMPDGELTELLAALKLLATKKPFISIAAEDTLWVQPRVACRVTYAEQLRNGFLRNAEWDTLLGAMRTPGPKK